MNRSRARLAALLLVIGAAGCTSQPTAVSPEPAAQERSRYGNGPFYQVHGRRYQVMSSSRGYKERGVASWYGKKFHGRLTSSREPYDMYAMTAAHKTLPLPTYVRVTNLNNDKSVVVKINDRGPFVANRIIDLSYAAALELDIIESGTGLVEVTAIDNGLLPEPEPAIVTAYTGDDAVNSAQLLYVQVGAFGDEENARRRRALLEQGGIGPAFVEEDVATTPALYRVRIGPIADAVEYDSLVLKLKGLGISEMHLVTD